MEKCPCETCITFPMCKVRAQRSRRFETAIGIATRENCEMLAGFLEHDELEPHPVLVIRNLFNLPVLEARWIEYNGK